MTRDPTPTPRAIFRIFRRLPPIFRGIPVAQHVCAPPLNRAHPGRCLVLQVLLTLRQHAHQVRRLLPSSVIFRRPSCTCALGVPYSASNAVPPPRKMSLLPHTGCCRQLLDELQQAIQR